MPSATPRELAAAIIECIDAGARVINLSLALAQPSSKGEQALEEAVDRGARRGVIVVAAAGNQGTLGSSAITRHPWVIPVVACDLRGRPMSDSNLGSSIGRRGLSAPGDAITSLGAEGRPLTLGGTSVAVPFVTGTIALLWSEFPAATAAQIKLAVTQVSATAARLGGSAVAGCRGRLSNPGDGECEDVSFMAKARQSKRSPDKSEQPPHRVRLPGFVSDEEIGLGDVIKHATHYLGIKALRWLRRQGGRTQPLGRLHRPAEVTPSPSTQM